MDSERLKELRRLAEQATQGPWKVGLHKNFVYEFQDNVLLFETVGRRTTQTKRMNNADYIAAANPATILQLLDEIERLKTENTELQHIVKMVVNERDELLKSSVKCELCSDKAEKEIERMKCCGNCDNMQVRFDGFDNFNGYSCGLHGEQYNKKVKRCNTCDKWEALDENNP